MEELFPNITSKTRKQAELAWILAKDLSAPKAGEMLSSFTDFYGTIAPEENATDFLRFYFNMKLEEAKKNDDTSSER